MLLQKKLSGAGFEPTSITDRLNSLNEPNNNKRTVRVVEVLRRLGPLGHPDAL